MIVFALGTVVGELQPTVKSGQALGAPKLRMDDDFWDGWMRLFHMTLELVPGGEAFFTEATLMLEKLLFHDVYQSVGGSSADI